ncbi:ML domain-containing protein [Sporodiniella umbellata]|nr:ML domain-containing protein [Sporodiniella umbellata]
MYWKTILLWSVFGVWSQIYAQNVWTMTEPPASNVQLVNCGSQEDLFQLESFSIEPELVKPGAEINITITGTLSTTVTEGAYADVMVKLGRILLLRKHFDICNELEKHKDDVTLQCPIQEGPIKVTQTVTLPKEIPPGAFKVFAKAHTVDDAPLACVVIDADFRKRRTFVEGFWVISSYFF